ncbi:MAG: DUF1624 domain-containing protein [bacterium]|nr:DUF1624 domain-containing protein [bacterium]
MNTKVSNNTRITGFDFARACAIFGMILENFVMSMEAAHSGPSWLTSIFNIFEGRSAPLFVVLAGVGISLMSKKMFESSGSFRQARSVLLKRALFLFTAGFIHSLFWEADILHFFAVYFIAAACFLSTSNFRLLGCAFIFMIVFVILTGNFDYNSGWIFGSASLAYTDLWSLEGSFRHIFFNGYHPLFPWMAFLLVGMWLGRLDLSNSAARKKILFSCIGIALIVKTGSLFLLDYFSTNPWGMPPETISVLFGIELLPPMPLYIIFSTSVSLALIIISIILCERFSENNLIPKISSIGQMSLSLYIMHVFVGIVPLDFLGILTNRSLSFAFVYSFLVVVLLSLFAILWSKKFNRGPLESFMRSLTE